MAQLNNNPSSWLSCAVKSCKLSGISCQPSPVNEVSTYYNCLSFLRTSWNINTSELQTNPSSISPLPCLTTLLYTVNFCKAFKVKVQSLQLLPHRFQLTIDGTIRPTGAGSASSGQGLMLNRCAAASPKKLRRVIWRSGSKWKLVENIPFTKPGLSSTCLFWAAMFLFGVPGARLPNWASMAKPNASSPEISGFSSAMR